jgi:hypothetical protein
MGTIPAGYTLDPSIDPKSILSRKYRHWTAGELIEFLADVLPETPLWINIYDEGTDEFIRPVEFLSSNNGKHVMIG